MLIFFLPFDWAVDVFSQRSSSPHVISTRTANRTADSLRTTQMTTTGRDTKVQPRQITLAPVETTLMKVSPYLKYVFSVQPKSQDIKAWLICNLWPFFNLFIEGFYIYHECDNVADGQKARLLSPLISSSSSQICVQFYYYMYGVDSRNLLRVLTRKPGGVEENWKKTGFQSPAWLLGSVTVSKQATEEITVSTRRFM